MAVRSSERPWTGLRAEFTLVVVATLVRLVYVAGTGVPRGGDARLYLGIARSVADGHLTTHGYPLQALYGVALTPAYVVGVDVDRWVTVLQIVVGVATVVVLYRLAMLLVRPGVAMAIGAAAAVWPTFVFWTRYIETETLFLFLLSCFLLVCARQLVTPGMTWRRWLGLATSAAGVAVCRTVGILVVWAGLAVLLAAFALRRGSVARARRTVLAAGVATLLAVTVMVALPVSRNRVLELRSVSDSLWSSTRTFHSSVEHAQRRTSLPRDVRGLPADEQAREVSDRALTFIREHPFDYGSRVGVRVINFMFPWLTADWGLSHRLLDEVLSLGLVALTLGALHVVPKGPRRQVLLLLLAVAGVQALAVAFGELDSEGRYRVPVELCLLLVAGMALDGFLTRRRRAAHARVEVSTPQR
jgi:Dolichyl-phosphate-mannose-protein mannosyltransferase